jgi:hypothetical protein
MEVIKLEREVLKKNDDLAADNRSFFKKKWDFCF